MTLYTNCFNFTSASRYDVPNPSQRTYGAITSYYFSMADEVLDQVVASHKGDNPALLVAYLNAYDCYFAGSTPLLRLFKWMNNVFLNEKWSKGTEAESAVIDEDIMRYESVGVARPARDLRRETEIAKVLWPSDGHPMPTGDKDKDEQEQGQLDARRQASCRVDVYAQLVPTAMKTWRLATFKHFGGANESPSMASMIAEMTAAGKTQEQVEMLRRLGRCFWAIGLPEDTMGFPDVLAILQTSG